MTADQTQAQTTTPIDLGAYVERPAWQELFQSLHTWERCGHMSGLWTRRITAGLDEVRDTRGSSILRASNALRQAASLVSGFRPMCSSSICAPCLCRHAPIRSS